MERVPHARVRHVRVGRAKLSARRVGVVAWPACDTRSGCGAGAGEQIAEPQSGATGGARRSALNAER